MKINIRPYWRREDGFGATTTALIMAGVAVAGSAVGAYGSLASANAQKNASNFNAEVASNNAKAAELQSLQDAQNLRNRNQRLRGSQIAAMSAAGITGGTGSDVEYDTRVQGELDALTTLYKGKVQGSSYRSQSELDRYAAGSAETSGYLSAGGTLLSGAGQAAYDYSSIANNPRFNRVQ